MHISNLHTWTPPFGVVVHLFSQCQSSQQALLHQHSDLGSSWLRARQCLFADMTAHKKKRQGPLRGKQVINYWGHQTRLLVDLHNRLRLGWFIIHTGLSLQWMLRVKGSTWEHIKLWLFLFCIFGVLCLEISLHAPICIKVKSTQAQAHNSLPFKFFN